MSRRRKKRAAAQVERQDTTRIDGWANLATGLGYSRDKRTWASYLDVAVLEDSHLENLYVGSDLAAMIVDSLPEYALRDGFELVYNGDADDVTDLRRGIEQELRRVECTEHLTNALCWGRLYGGGALLIGADDGGDAEAPIDDERVRALRFLNDLERRDLTPYSWYDDPREQGYGQPEIYMLTPHGYSRSGGVQVSMIHESRVIETYGSRTPVRYRAQNRGWPLSVLQRVHETIRDFDQAFGAVGHMLLDCSQGVLSQKGLIRAIGQLGSSVIDARMASIDTYRSSNRMLVLDADGEEFKYVERTFSGVDAILALFMLRVASAARMPVTVLFGRSPAGLNATGESDLEGWYASIGSYRTHVVQPILERIVRIVSTSLGSPDPESWGVTFPSLWIEGPRDIAERKKLVADRDVAYVTSGVYDPEEVALARAQGIDAEVVIDEDARRRQLDLAVEDDSEDDEQYQEDLPVSDEPAGDDVAKVAPEDAVDPQSALNGAQVKSLVDVVIQVVNGMIPRQTAIEIITAAFPVDLDAADRILGDVGQGFVPRKEPGKDVEQAPDIDTEQTSTPGDGDVEAG